ncbi:hypothetical protein GCM10010964_18440 [Caldovatus sediminis]|uniref:Uncharacterized protein n=1 Tax=Caldovatus sediminis TaxID=2041189 RepID=A0A8J2ZAC8_9PROT|nr:hypothetical protein [Caldovatus sediminis]GGG30836.1 hypothetical protein GCM10010964_18440 [Caldovatus sediminis]
MTTPIPTTTPEEDPMPRLPGPAAPAPAASAPEPAVAQRLGLLFRRAARSAALLADPEASGGMRFACFSADLAGWPASQADGARRLRMTVSIEVVS